MSDGIKTPFLKAVRWCRSDLDGSVRDLVRWAIYYKKCYRTEFEYRVSDHAAFRKQGIEAFKAWCLEKCLVGFVRIRGHGYKVYITEDPYNGIKHTWGRGDTFSEAFEDFKNRFTEFHTRKCSPPPPLTEETK